MTTVPILRLGLARERRPVCAVGYPACVLLAGGGLEATLADRPSRHERAADRGPTGTEGPGFHAAMARTALPHRHLARGFERGPSTEGPPHLRGPDLDSAGRGLGRHLSRARIPAVGRDPVRISGGVSRDACRVRADQGLPVLPLQPDRPHPPLTIPSAMEPG